MMFSGLKWLCCHKNINCKQNDDADDLTHKQVTIIDLTRSAVSTVCNDKIQWNTKRWLTLLTMTKPWSDMLRLEPFRKSVTGATPINAWTTNAQFPDAFSTCPLSLPHNSPQQLLTSALPTPDSSHVFKNSIKQTCDTVARLHLSL